MAGRVVSFSSSLFKGFTVSIICMYKNNRLGTGRKYLGDELGWDGGSGDRLASLSRIYWLVAGLEGGTGTGTGLFKSPVNVYPTLSLCFSLFVMERWVVGSGTTLMSGEGKKADESNTLVVDRCLKIMSA